MNIAAIKSRLKASGIHLCFSIAIFIAALYFIVFHWYPVPHFTSNGGWQGVRIMLFVDIVLGPFLTLLLVNPNKSVKAIVFDLSIILTIQLCAFVWGIYAVHSQRPLAISFWDGQFYPVLQGDMKTQEAEQQQLEGLSDQRPAIVYTRQPATADEKTGVTTFGFVEGMNEYQLVFLFDPLKPHIGELFTASADYLSDSSEQFNANKDAWLAQEGLDETGLAFVPFNGRYGKSVLIFSSDGSLLDSIAQE